MNPKKLKDGTSSMSMMGSSRLDAKQSDELNPSTAKERFEMPSSTDEAEEAQVDKNFEFYACLLEPGGRTTEDATYIGMRRLLLSKKAKGSNLQRHFRGTGSHVFVSVEGDVAVMEKQWQRLCCLPGVYSPLQTVGKLTPHQSFKLSWDSGRWSSTLLHGYDRSSWATRSRPSISSGPRSHGDAADLEMVSQNQTEPGYSFVGMHWIFDDLKASVNVLCFGHHSSELLAVGAADGGLIICNVANPPRVLQNLKGHAKEITDFDWSLNNQYLCSSSVDKSVRVWNAENGRCLRVICGTAAQLCIRFHPLNNNFVYVGHADQGLTVINFSTGRVLHRLSVERNITAMDMSHTGHILFAGDSQARLYLLFESRYENRGFINWTSDDKGLHRKSPTTTVQFRNFSRLAGGPVLLVANQDGSLRFFSVALEVDGYLSLKCSLKLPPLARNIRASFCPLLSLERGEYIVSGTEDTNVYFYDFTRPLHPCVNIFQGHSVPGVGVAWNHGENLLATSDCKGVVIVWKRARDGR